MDQQPSLFPEAEPKQAETVDTDEIAAKIGANARPVEYEDRTSEAAIDQGRGPISVPTSPAKQPRLVELPGKNGRNNWYNEPPSRTEVLRGQTAAEIEARLKTNKIGAEAARQALEHPQQ